MGKLSLALPRLVSAAVMIGFQGKLFLYLALGLQFVSWKYQLGIEESHLPFLLIAYLWPTRLS
jgi:hypothetical protein